MQILQEGIGNYHEAYNERYTQNVYDAIVKFLRKEEAVFYLNQNRNEPSDVELFNWILKSPTVEQFLDAVEVSMRYIDIFVRENAYYFRKATSLEPDEAISEINDRYQEAGFGYRYSEGNIVNISSEFIHSETIIPTLKLISDPRYESVDIEFRKAHADFREKNYESCLVECGKAFESTLKIIGAQRNWNIKNTDPASKLVAAAFDSGFIPDFMQAEFAALRAILEGGVPAIRNRQGGHGAGTTPRNVPRELAEFQLHQTAAAILFLINHDKAIP